MIVIPKILSIVFLSEGNALHLSLPAGYIVKNPYTDCLVSIEAIVMSTTTNSSSTLV